MIFNWKFRKRQESTSFFLRQKDRLYEQLEERVLFDAVPDGSLEQLDGLTNDPFAPAVEATADEFAINPATAAEQSPQADRNEVVFVDKSVDNYQQLVAELAVGQNTEVVFLDQRTDGLKQIADVLAGREGIDAIHIIAHGNEAELHLGSTILTEEGIRGDYANELAVVGSALSNSADLLIYGCNFGAGSAGLEAAEALAEATGADVAASDDDTGAVGRGGDWELEIVTGGIETTVLEAASWNGLLAPTLRLDLGNVQPGEVDLTGPGDGSVGLRATWVDAGYVGAQRIDLRATIVSQDTTLTHDLFTRSFAGSYFPSIASVGQDWVEIQWDIFATGTTNPVTADIVVGLNDLDGPNNEAIRFNVCDPVVEHLLLSSNTQMGHSFDIGTGDVTLDGQANYTGIDERISVEVAYYDETGFTMSRTANSGFFLSFDFNEILTYTDPLEFDCSNFLLPVSADDFAIAAGGAPVSIAILDNDSSNNSGAANTVELVVPVNATNIVLDNDFDEVGFDIAGEGTWFFDESTMLLTFTPEVGFTSDPTPIQYTFENIDGIGSNTSTVTIDMQYVGPSIDLDGTAAGAGYSTSFTEGTSPVAFVNSDFAVTDGDSTEMESITITPAGVVNGANEILTFNGDGATSISFGMDGLPATTLQITVNGVVLDVAYDGADFTITRNGGGTIANADVEALLTAASYENATSAAIPGDRRLDISVSDGVFDSNIAAATITVIPDYLSVSASTITINEDESTLLGVTVDPDLYLGGPLQDVVGTSVGFRSSSAGGSSTDFTIPDNVTGIVITGYSTEPDDTAANDTYNDDYQVLSAYIDVAKGISNGTLTRHIDLSSGASRDADQFSWLGAELGTAVQDGSATLIGETASGTNPTFTIVGNTLQIVENHGLETAYHVEFMTSNRQSTNFVGSLSGAQLPGETSTTLTIPAGTNYLLLNENAAAPGSNFRYEYKGFSRIYIDLDTMTASGTIAAEIGENSDRTVTYSFENYDISSSTPGGVLASGATIVGDVTAQAAVANSPNIYIDGSGDLVIERTAAFATDFTSMYTLEAYQRTGYSSIAAIVDANADDQFFDATLNGGLLNTLTFDVPASAQIGVFRLSMGTPGGNGDNENMGTGFAIIDLENGTSSGSFMNIRTTTPDLLSWSDVPLFDNPATAGIDERVLFTDPSTVSNRATLGDFTDGWGGTAYFDLVANPDGTRTVTFNAISDVGDNAYQDYQTHGQFTWLGNEPFRIRTTGAGGTFSHGSPVLDGGGNPTGEWEIDVLDLPIVTYTPDPHYSGTGYLEVELLSTGEYERIDIEVLPIADTPSLTLTDPPTVNKGQTSDLSSAVSAALVDTDGSESITLIELSAIADGFTVSDGTNNFTAGGGTNSIDITSWNLATLTMDSPVEYTGTEVVNVRVQTTDNMTIGGTPYSDTTLPTDTNPGEMEATGSLNVTWVNVMTALDLDASDNTASGADYAAAFTEGGAAVPIADSDTTLVDSDDATMASVTITPGVGEFQDGSNEQLTFNGDGATSISFAIDGVAAATQQITINGSTLDVAYDGTQFVITRSGPGEILNADVAVLLSGTTYANLDPTPTISDRTFAIKTFDGTADSNVATSTISINTNSAAAAWSITGPASVDEGGTANFSIDLTGNLLQAGETATVVLTLTDGSTSPADYADFLTAVSNAVASRGDLAFNTTSRTLTFTSTGSSMALLLVPLVIADDSTIEGSESFSIDLSAAGSTTGETISVDGAQSSVSTTINDTQGVGGAADGPATWSVSGPASIDEGGSASFTISLSGTLQSGEDTSVDLNLADIDTNATDYGDFLAAVNTAVFARPDLSFDSGTGTLAYVGDGSPMADLVVNLAITDDSAVEGVEQFSVGLSNSSSTTGAATAIDSANGSVTTTINDTQGVGGGPDQADWSILGDASVDEGGTASFMISLDALLQASETSTIDLSLVDIETTSFDYGDFFTAVQTAVSSRPDLSFDNGTGTLTFTSTGSLMSDLTVNLNAIDDTQAEGAERYQILLSNPGSSTGAAIGVDPSGNNLTTTINDTVGDGGALEEMVWSFGADQTVPEGNSTAYVLSLTGTLATGESVGIDISLTDLDTTSADYSDLSTAISNSVATYNASPAAGSLSWDGTRLTLTGDGSGPMTDLPIALTTIDDMLAEGVEDFRVFVANASSSTGVAVSINPTADDSVTTIDDTVGPGADDATWSVSGATSVDEGGTLQYTLGLAGTLQAGESAFVELSLGDVTTNSSDYSSFVTAVQNAIAARPDLAFDAGTGVLTYTGNGSPMADLLVNLSITDDTLVEGPEQFDLTLSNAGSGTGPAIGIDGSANNITTTINDTAGDGGPAEPGGEWSISGSSNVNEGGVASYVVSVSGDLQAGEDVSVELDFTDLETDSSDYAGFTAAVQDAVAAYAGPGTLFFDSGTQLLTFVSSGTGPMADLNISLGANDDALVEGPERFRIDLSNPQSSTGLPATVSSSNGSRTTTINDNEAAIWSVTSTPAVDEGGIATFTYSLSGVPQAGEQISAALRLTDVDTNSTDYAAFTTAVQTAVASRPDLSFDAGTGLLTFTGTGTAMTDLVVNLAINDDSLTEGPEDFVVDVTLPSSSTGSAVQVDSLNNAAAVTINDTLGDGGAAETANWSVSAPTMIDEGDTLAYSINLSGVLQAGEDASIDLGFTDLGTSASDRADFDTQVQAAVTAYGGPGALSYDAATATLTFISDGNALGPFSINLPIIDDTFVEGPEDLRLTLSGAVSSTGSSIGIDSSNATVTTTVNDTQGVGGAADGPAEWSLTGSTNVDEGGVINYTLSLSEVLQAGEDARVTVTLSDLTTNSGDYASLTAAISAAVLSRPNLAFDSGTGVLTYTADGNPMSDLSFSLAVTDDSLVEGVESLQVGLTSPTSTSGASIAIEATAATVTTSVNDTQGIGGGPDTADWSILGDSSVDEGGSASFTVSLDALLQSGETASIELTLSDIETSAADYSDVANAIQTAISSRPDLSFDSLTGTLTFISSGSLMSDLTVNLNIIDDMEAEGPERYQILLSNPGSTTGATTDIDPSGNNATTTINDTIGDGGAMEEVIWSFGDDQTVAESNAAAYVLSLSGVMAAGESVRVDLNLTDLTTTTSDYGSLNSAVASAVAAYNVSTAPGSLTWDGTAITFTSDGTGPMSDLNISLGTVGDGLVEGVEDLRVSIANASSSTGVAVSIDALSDGSVTTIDDTTGPSTDEATWSVVGATNVDEGGTLQYTISLAGTLQAAEDASVELALSNITTDAADYASFASAVQAAVASRTDLSFDAGTGVLTYTGDGNPMADLVINLAVTDDTLLEGPEELDLILSNAGSGTGALIGVSPTGNNVTTTINDTAGDGGVAEPGGEWSITGASNANEGGSASYAIAVSGDLQAGEDTTVELRFTDIETDSADYGDWATAVQSAITTYSGPGSLSFNSTTGELTFVSDGTGPMATLNISLGIADEALIEGPERFRIDLGNPQSSTGLTPTVSSSNGSVTTTINDDEAAVWSVASPASIDEGGTVQFTFSLAGTPQAGEEISVQVDLNDTDTNSLDYASFAAALQTAVTLRPDLTFDAVTATLTFNSSGVTMADLVVDLAITDDSFVEGAEAFSVDLSVPSSATGAGVQVDPANDSAAVTINDTVGVGGGAETSTWSVTSPPTVDEGDTLPVTVSLSGVLQSGEEASVVLNFTDLGTTPADRGDFDAALQAAVTAYSGPGSLTYNTTTSTLSFVGDGNAMNDLMINLPITDDTLLEGPEAVNLALSAPGSSTGASIAIDAGAATTTTTIDDTQGVGGSADGPAEWSLVGTGSVDEGGTINYTLGLSEVLQAGENASVVLGLSDVTTTAADYGDLMAAIQTAAAARPDLAFNSTTGELIFTGTGSAMADLAFSLNVIDDSAVEGAESLTVSLSSPASTSGVAVGLASGSVSVTTTINDTQGVGGMPDRADWSILGDAVVDEGGVATLTISLDAVVQVGETSSVELSLLDIETGAADHSDLATAIGAAVSSRSDLTFDSATGTLTFTGTGALMQDLVVSLTAVDDTLAEGPERYQILLSNPSSSSGAAIGIDPAASQLTTTIRDTLGDGGVLEQAIWSIGFDQTVSEGDASVYLLSQSGALAAGEAVSVDLNLTDIDTTPGDYDDFNAAVTAAVAGYNAGGTPGSLAWDGTTLTFTSDGTGTMTDVAIALNTVNDTFSEGVEDLQVSLTNAISFTGVFVSIDGTADDSLTTIDDTTGPSADEATWSASGAATVDEGGTLQYTIRLAGTLQAGETAFVQLALGNITASSADYASFASAAQSAVAARPDLTFDPGTGVLTYTGDGSPMTDLTVDLAVVDDALLEGPEQFGLTLSGGGSGTGALVGIDPTGNNVTTTINDTVGDGGIAEVGGQWRITGSSNVNEGATGAYAIAIDGLLQAGEAASVQLNMTDIETGAADVAAFNIAVQVAVAVYSGPGSVSFDAAAGVLTFVSDGTGPMSDLLVDLATNDDSLVEGPERFRIDLSNPQSSTGLLPSVSASNGSLTTNINDNEAVTWAIASTPNVDEGGSAQFTYTLAGIAQAGEEVSVVVNLADIDTNAADYASFVNAIQTAVGARPDLTFDAATATLTFVGTGSVMADLVVGLQVVDDSLTEGPESFSVGLSLPSSGTGASVLIDGANDTASVAIADTVGNGGASEAANWSVSAPVSIDEGGTLAFTVNLSGVLQNGEDASVNLGFADLQTDATDHADFATAVQAAVAAYAGPGSLSYDSVTSTLTFVGDGNAMGSLVINVPIIDDALLEGPEDLGLTLSGPASTTAAPIGVDAANAAVTTTVNDTQGLGGVADGPAEWSISGNSSVDEGGTASYTLSLSEVLQAGETASIQLSLADLTTDGSDRGDFAAAIQSAVVSRPDVSFDSGTGVLTFTGTGAPMNDLTFDLPVIDDSLVEGAETFQVNLANPASSSGVAVAIAAGSESVTTTINDTQGVGGRADSADWSIRGDGNVDEGGVANFTIRLDALLQNGEQASIDLSLTDLETSSADYASLTAAVQAAVASRPDLSFDTATGRLTYTSDQTLMSDLSFSLAITDDAVAEGPERFLVALANSQSPTGAAVAVDPAASSASTTINDTVGDGGPNEQPTWSLAGPVDGNEGGNALFTISLSETLQLGETATIELALADIDTTSADYGNLVTAVQTAVASRPDLTFDAATGTLTFSSDGTSMTDLTIDLGLVDDVLAEGPEDYRISLTNPGSTTGVFVGLAATADDAISTIIDSDTVGGTDDATWSLSGSTSVDEGGIATMVLSLSGTLALGKTAYVDLSLADIETTSADYGDFLGAVQSAASIRPDLTFDVATQRLTYTGDGTPMADLNVSLTITDDILVEGAERFEIVLANAGSGTGPTIGIAPNANRLATTINDTLGVGGATEAAEWHVSGSSNIDEGGSANLTIGLNGLLQSGETASVILSVADLSTAAADRADFVSAVQAAVAARSDLSFNATTGELTYTSNGSTMADLTFAIAANDDAIVEGPEQFNVSLSNPTSSTAAAVTVDAARDDLTTTINDTIGDGGPLETATWSLTAPASADEGASADLLLALTGTMQAGETAYVRLTLADIDTTAADYADLVTAIQTAVASRPDLSFDPATQTVTFTSSGVPMTPLTVNLDLIDDTVTEGPERLSVTLSQAGSGTDANVLVDPVGASVEVTINDTQGAGGAAEESRWTVAGSSSVAEGGIASYTVSLSGVLQSGEDASVQLGLTELSTSPADHSSLAAAVQTALIGRTDLAFDPVTGVLTYFGDGAPMTDLTFSIAAAVDGQVEGTELFEITASNPSSTTGAAIAVAGATVTTSIVDVEPTTNANAAPIASDDTAIVFENSSVTGNLLNNDSDPDGDVLLIDTNPVFGAANGAVTINSDGSFSYTPNTGFTGTDSFTYQITDPDGNASTATVTIAVSPDTNGALNNLPDANADSLATQKNVPLNGSVLDNDSDPNGDPLAVIDGNGNVLAPGFPATFTTSRGGTVVLRSDGTFDYTPADDFTGTDSFEYTISDSAGGVSAASVSLSVFDASPVAKDDINVTSVNTPAVGNVLTNDHAGPDQNDRLTVNTAPVTAPTNGTLVLNPDGSYTYTPNAGFTGSDSFEYEVCDEAGNCDTGEVTLEVRDAAGPGSPGNTPPVASNDQFDVFTNGSVTTSVTANDGDPDGDVVSVTFVNGVPVPAGSPAVVTTANGGTVLLAADGTLTYTPAIGFIGEDTFSYTLRDPAGNTDSAVVKIEVAPDRNGTENEGPTAGDVTATGQKNVPITGSVLANDGDVNGDPLAVNTTPVSGPANGTLVLNPDGTFTYTPGDDFVGNDSFIYEVCDASGACDQATVILAIFDAPPTAVGDIAVTSVDAPVTGNVLTNDSDPNPNDDLTVTAIDGQPLNPAGHTTPGGGTIVMNANGTYTYTPAAGFVGNDTFSYTVTDEGGNPATTTISVEVRDTSTPPNNPPIANDDSPVTFENTPVTGSLLSNDSDPDGDPLTINTTPAAAPTNGSLVIQPDGTFTYTPDLGFVGTDSFVYEVCDDGGVCSSATVTITVQADPTPGVNDAPFANDDNVYGTEDATITGNLLANDSDPNGDPLSINTTPVSGPSNGTLLINSDGTFAYTPDAGFVGSDTFEYEVCDDQGGCSTATVTVNVAADPPPNAPAVVNDESFTLFENTAVTGSLTANDGDPEGGPIAINTTPVSGPTNGSITIDPDGTFTYTPNPGFTGADTVEYEVCDAEGNCDTGIVTFNVQVDSNGPANNAPTAADDAALTTLNEAVSGNVLANDSDPNGDALNVLTSPVVAPANGTLVLNADGTFTYTPNNDFAGNDSFVYAVDDGNGGTTTATVLLTVFAQRPTANPDLVTTTAGTPVTGNVLANDTDSDTADALTVNTTPTTTPGHGTLVLSTDGTFIYTPNAGFTGVDTFEYEVCDEAGVCDTGRVTVAIADISSALEVVTTIPNGENFDVTMTLTVRNTGGTQLSDLNIAEDIAAQFGNGFVAVTNPVLDSSGVTSGVAPNVNPAWSSDTTQNLLDPAGPSAVLQPSESFALTFTVTIDPDADGTSSSVTAQASVSAIDTSTTTPLLTTDLSDAGGDPQSTNSGAPGDTGSADDVTHVLIGDAGLVSEVIDIERDGVELILTIDFILENTGTAELNDLVLIDDLMAQLGDNFESIVAAPSIIASDATVAPSLNAGWGSDTSQNMFDGDSGLLKPGESIHIQLRVKTVPGGAGVVELFHQGQGGGQALAPDGSPLTNPDGSSMGPVLDLSDSGSDPHGTNPGAPGDTGGTDDPTATAVGFYTYDTFNDFSRGHGDAALAGPLPKVERQLLTREINTLAPEPIFSGSARPGTQVVGRIYNSAGHVVGEAMSFADTGGNWLVQFRNVDGLEFDRIEFVELVGQGDPFGAHGDIYGYLGTDAHNNDYAAMEPVTGFVERYSLGSVYRGSTKRLLQDAHRYNNNPLGFGV